MKKNILLTSLFLFLCVLLRAQAPGKDISFHTDPNKRVDKQFENPKDSLYLYFDDGFDADTVTLVVDNRKKYILILNSDPTSKFAKCRSIPKSENTQVAIIVNKKTYKVFAFNKKFGSAHLDYDNRQLSVTYSNRLYHYN